ncbi:hypothetical protein EYC80_004432 [Monilinia laxa]|uniref:Uncharacterized protein n=1 Tax=Monilinia laxa TaxID=61186 RepID=A0A5N6KN59_MONLA|nr:hypothetical protein EYC80_004432 [Monilinia laxa]
MALTGDELVGESRGIDQGSRMLIIREHGMDPERKQARYMKILESTAFESLSLLSSIFDVKRLGDFDNKDLICYDPDNTTKTQRWQEKVVYMKELIALRSEENAIEYKVIADWPAGSLWTYTHYLMRFLSKIPFPPASYIMDGVEDIENVWLLAKLLGAKEEMMTELRQNLRYFINPSLEPPPDDKEEIVKKKRKMPTSHVADKKIKKSRSTINLNGDTLPPEKQLKMIKPTSRKKEKLQSIPEKAYIRLNESSHHYYLVEVKDVKHASEYLGEILEDLCKGDLTGSRRIMAGKDIAGLPTLLWDQVITFNKNTGYGSIRNIAAEMMDSWQEDERWVPVRMFVESIKGSVEDRLKNEWGPSDHRRASWFDKFVRPSV